MYTTWNVWLRTWLAWGRRHIHGDTYGLPVRLRLEAVRLEDRLAPAFFGGVSVAAGDVDGDGFVDIVTGPGPGGGPHVRIFSGASGQVIGEFFSHDPADRSGVFVAVGDMTADGRFDIAVATRGGKDPAVRVFDALTLAEVKAFTPFGSEYRGGVSLALGDVDADGTADLVAGRMDGGGEVRVLSGRTGEVLRTLPAQSQDFAGGAYVAAADLTGDGKADVIIGAGPGGGPRVRAVDGATGEELFSVLAYEDSFRGGITVAAGDVNGDGTADVVTGPGLGGGPRARVFDGRDGSPMAVEIGNYFAYTSAFRGGLFVAAADLNADGKVDIVTGPGPGGGPHVRAFQATDAALLANFLAYEAPAIGGGFSKSSRGPTDVAPTIGMVGDLSAGVNQPVSSIAFRVEDADSAVDTLVVTAASSNPTLLPNDRIRIDGVGSDRTLTLSPVADQTGSAKITLTVLDPTGLSATTAFTFTVLTSPLSMTLVPPNADGSFSFRESDGLVREAVIPLDLSAGSAGRSVLRVPIGPVQFDQSDTAATDDTFAVYVNAAGQRGQTLVDRGVAGTSAFALNPRGSELGSGRVRYDGSAVEIDLSGLTGQAELVLQLTSADDDRGTTVEVGKPVLVAAEGTPQTAAFEPTQTATVGTAVDLAGFLPADQLGVEVGNVRFDPADGRYRADVRVRNDGAPVGRQVRGWSSPVSTRMNSAWAYGAVLPFLAPGDVRAMSCTSRSHTAPAVAASSFKLDTSNATSMTT